MKNYITLLFILLAFNFIHAQNTDAKLKYQEAEKAFEAGNYLSCISFLDETEKLLGQGNSNTLYLRTKAEFKIWETKPFENFEQLDRLKKLCNEYLEKYDKEGLSDVFELLQKLPKVNSQEELVVLGEQLHTESSIQKHEQAIKEQNMAFVEGGMYMKGARKEAIEITVNDFYIAKYETAVKQWNNYLEATGRTGNNNIELVHLLELYNHVSKVSNTAMGVVNIAGGGVTGKLTGLLSNNKHLSYRIPQQDNSAFSRFLPARAYKKRSLAYFNEVLYPEIMAYCKWLEQKYGGTWRLPTDAEWEYAARNGNTTEHLNNVNNKEELKKYRTYYGDVVPVGELSGLAYIVEKTVGRKQPNALGLYDMIGNVSELLYDYYDKDYYKYSPKDNPKGPDQGTYKAARDDIFRSAEAFRYVDLQRGFRVVYIPD